MGFQEAAEVARLIPVNEEDWFDRNGMSQYNCNLTMQSSVDNVANCLLLRADVHQLFNLRKFVFIPKHASYEVGVELLYHLVCHMIGS